MLSDVNCTCCIPGATIWESTMFIEILQKGSHGTVKQFAACRSNHQRSKTQRPAKRPGISISRCQQERTCPGLRCFCLFFLFLPMYLLSCTVAPTHMTHTHSGAKCPRGLPPPILVLISGTNNDALHQLCRFINPSSASACVSERTCFTFFHRQRNHLIQPNVIMKPMQSHTTLVL